MTFQYVRLQYVPDWLRCGWVASPALNGTHHGFWSALMIWPCDCKPVIPKPEEVKESA